MSDETTTSEKKIRFTPELCRQLFWFVSLLTTIFLALTFLLSARARVHLYASLYTLDSQSVKEQTFELLCREGSAAASTLLRLVAEKDVKNVDAVIDLHLKIDDEQRTASLRSLIQYSASHPSKCLDYRSISRIMTGKKLWSTVRDLANDDNPRIREETWCLIAANSFAYGEDQDDHQSLAKTKSKQFMTIVRPTVLQAAQQFLQVSDKCPAVEAFHAHWLKHDLDNIEIKRDYIDRDIFVEAFERQFVRLSQDPMRSWICSYTPYRLAKTGKFLNIVGALNYCQSNDIDLFPNRWDTAVHFDGALEESVYFRILESSSFDPAEFVRPCTRDESMNSGMLLTWRVAALPQKQRKLVLNHIDSHGLTSPYHTHLRRCLETAISLTQLPAEQAVELMRQVTKDQLTDNRCYLDDYSKDYKSFEYRLATIDKLLRDFQSEPRPAGLGGIFIDGLLQRYRLQNEHCELFTNELTFKAWALEAPERKTMFIKRATENAFDVSRFMEIEPIRNSLTDSHIQLLRKNKERCDQFQNLVDKFNSKIKSDPCESWSGITYIRRSTELFEPAPSIKHLNDPQEDALWSIRYASRDAEGEINRLIHQLLLSFDSTSGQTVPIGCHLNLNLRNLSEFDIASLFAKMPTALRHKVYANDLHHDDQRMIYQIVFLSDPTLVADFLSCFKQQSTSVKVRMLNIIKSYPFAFQPALKQLIKMTHDQRASTKLDLYSMLVQASVQVDRTGNSVIPLLMSLAKNKDLSYIHRAIAICGLRRYYELNRVQSDLKHLISILNGDLKIIAERSLDRVRQLTRQERLTAD